MAAKIRHKIVAIDGWVKVPQLGVNADYDVAEYTNSTAEELLERTRDATIIMTSATPVPGAVIKNATNLLAIACNGTGTDFVDKEAVKEAGVWLCHVPAQNTDSVSEHAFALYFAVRRKIVQLHNLTADGSSWSQRNALHLTFDAPPRTNSEETLVIIGYGALGKNVEKIGKALGMAVLVAERKGATVTRDGRIAFEDALTRGTLFIVVAPLDADTRNMIAKTEFDQMDPTSIVINVGRGGIVNEGDLAQALREHKLGGAATDVFEREPAVKDSSPLLDASIPNLVLSPHLAWYSSKTIKGTLVVVKSNLEGLVSGKPQNVVISGREYS